MRAPVVVGTTAAERRLGISAMPPVIGPPAAVDRSNGDRADGGALDGIAVLVEQRAGNRTRAEQRDVDVRPRLADADGDLVAGIGGRALAEGRRKISGPLRGDPEGPADIMRQHELV